ncbi:MAG: hypothetical protein PHO25_01580, partial [Syntrophomonadaceae bacterium]|nr:hypothetical protein [Syntrophomonadaceae bacterium]
PGMLASQVHGYLNKAQQDQNHSIQALHFPRLFLSLHLKLTIPGNMNKAVILSLSAMSQDIISRLSLATLTFF